MANTYQHFGEWVRRWRKAKGLTQQELADMVGVRIETVIRIMVGKTKSYISNIERNEPNPTTKAPIRPRVEVVDKIGKALSKSVAEAREMAGYGIKENAGTSSVNSRKAATQLTEAPNDLEGLLIYYFRALPAEVKPDLIAVAAAYYKQSHMSPEQAQALATQKKRAYDQLGLQEGEELQELPLGVG